jgi:hypothetical protein
VTPHTRRFFLCAGATGAGATGAGSIATGAGGSLTFAFGFLLTTLLTTGSSSSSIVSIGFAANCLFNSAISDLVIIVRS